LSKNAEPLEKEAKNALPRQKGASSKTTGEKKGRFQRSFVPA